MRFAYFTYSSLIGFGFIIISLFNFIENDNNKGRLFLYLALQSFIAAYYIFKTLYYLRHQATFNEISFVVFMPISVVLQIFMKSILGVDLENLATVELNGFDTQQQLNMDFIDFIMLPYLIFSSFLLLRTYLRYPFIRLHGRSDRGFPSKLVALVLTISIPLAYLIVGLIIMQNAILVIFGLIYGLIGLIGFFV